MLAPGAGQSPPPQRGSKGGFRFLDPQPVEKRPLRGARRAGRRKSGSTLSGPADRQRRRAAGSTEARRQGIRRTLRARVRPHGRRPRWRCRRRLGRRGRCALLSRWPPWVKVRLSAKDELDSNSRQSADLRGPGVPPHHRADRPVQQCPAVDMWKTLGISAPRPETRAGAAQAPMPQVGVLPPGGSFRARVGRVSPPRRMLKGPSLPEEDRTPVSRRESRRTRL